MKILSPYVHYTRVSKGDIIILDSYNNNIFRISVNKSDRFFWYVNHPNDINNDNSLVHNNIIVDEDSFDGVDLLGEFKNKKDYLHLVILPTEDCNFRCSYCYEEHHTRSMDEDVINSIIKFVEERIPEFEALRIEWFGGEPLISKDIVFTLSEAFIQICKKYRKPYYASMTTNGYYLDIATFKKLFRYKVVRYQITLDGMKDYHDNQRYLSDGSGSFDTIVENLRAIRDNIKSNFFNITIRSNITPENREQFSNFLDFVKKEFSNDARFNFLWKIAWKPNSKSCDTYLDQSSLRGVLKESSIRKLKLDTSRRQMMKFGNICYACNKNSFIIGPGGNLYKCTVAFDKEINNIGKLLSSGEMRIDQNKYRFWTEEKTDCKTKACLKCFLYPSCLGIYCNLNNQDENQNFLCSGFKTYVDDYLNCIAECGDDIINLEI